MPRRVILFDLDGTLLDTAPDLTAAVNAVMRSLNRPEVPLGPIRERVSQGRASMLAYALGCDKTEPFCQMQIPSFLAHYRDTQFMGTQAFAGIPELLDLLQAQGYTWGIVTNKPKALTEPLLTRFPWAQSAACVITPEDSAAPKPSPAPLFQALQVLKQSVKDAIYVGDHEVDGEAAHAAGMPCLLASFGYASQEAKENTHLFHATLQEPRELLTYLERD